MMTAQTAKFFRQPRATALSQLETYLDRTAWGRGVYTQHLQVPGARPGQIRAGARKLYDVLKAQVRKSGGVQ
jgi:hypothetical protein